MEIFGTLPVWIQLVIAFLAAGVLILLNLGWLMQARGWLQQQKQRRRPTKPDAATDVQTPRTGRA